MAVTEDLVRRTLNVKDFLKNPLIIEAYPYKYLLLVDELQWSGKFDKLLMAIEQLEERDWVLHSISAADYTGMYALLRRGSR